MSAPVDSHKRNEAYLVLPDGARVLLPGSHQLYEIADGELYTSRRRITRKELEAFMDSRPREYTIKSLLDFVEGIRSQP